MSTVGSIFSEMLPRLSKSDLSVSFIAAMQTTVDVLVRRLWVNKSDLLAAPMTPVAVLAGSASFPLPTDLLGLRENPYMTIEGQPGRELAPLPPGRRYAFTQQGTPEYYEVLGSTCWLFPTPSANVSIKAMYNQDPPKLTGMESTIPFNGLFDPVIKDAALQIGSQGVFVVSTPVFETMVRNFVDQILQIRNPKNISFFHSPTGRQSRW